MSNINLITQLREGYSRYSDVIRPSELPEKNEVTPGLIASSLYSRHISLPGGGARIEKVFCTERQLDQPEAQPLLPPPAEAVEVHHVEQVSQGRPLSPFDDNKAQSILQHMKTSPSVNRPTAQPDTQQRVKSETQQPAAKRQAHNQLEPLQKPKIAKNFWYH
jgi:hypothetical protein